MEQHGIKPDKGYANSHKAIFYWKDKNGATKIRVVCENKNNAKGEKFKIEKTETVNATLTTCDKDSIDLMISILERLREKIGK